MNTSWDRVPIGAALSARAALSKASVAGLGPLESPPRRIRRPLRGDATFLPWSVSERKCRYLLGCMRTTDT
jgi:hypothetical protein